MSQQLGYGYTETDALRAYVMGGQLPYFVQEMMSISLTRTPQRPMPQRPTPLMDLQDRAH
jgi:hypothetical protein